MAHTTTRWLWILLIFYAILIIGVFAQQSLTSGQGVLLMPLDDVYIHFQYARQLSLGEPYIYNPGQPPTSGATSFIYPYLLALGYQLGFHGLNLGWWALCLGAGALIITSISLWHLLRIFDIHYVSRFVLFPIFLLTGSFTWHFMSGMETGILLALMLLTLWAFLRQRPAFFALFASLMALTRPEGSIMALIAVVIVFFTWLADDQPHRPRLQFRQWILCVVPILALLIQPVVNASITGTFVASGNQSKSILAMIPNDMSVITSRVMANILQMLTELLTGYSTTEGWYWYTFPLIGVLGFVGLVMHLRIRQFRYGALLTILWFVAVIGAVATLDNAFWHFKRYQMPLQLLLMVYAFVPLNRLFQYIGRWRYPVGIGVWGLSLVLTFFPFVGYYMLNTSYVFAQPYQMAQWLNTNTPQDAIIAVHDVGMMRYMGERTTLDIVGLTTPDAATYWRNGPGSVAEFIQGQQPDYIASYGVGHGYGLAYLAQTDWYAEPLAEFSVEGWQRAGNVALAAGYQAIYKPRWQDEIMPDVPLQPYTLRYTEDEQLLAYVDVADVLSEQAHRYMWQSESGLDRFASIVYQQPYIDCVLSSCRVLDGGRIIDIEERFEIQLSQSSQYLNWVVRVHPVDAITLGFGVVGQNGLCQVQSEAAIFQQAGFWLEVSVSIHLEHPQDSIQLCTQPDGAYEAYSHWIYETSPPDPRIMPDATLATYQNSSFALEDAQLTIDQGSLAEDIGLLVDLLWYHLDTASGDYRFFLHIYDDITQPPVVQVDGYSMGGVAPPSNWQPGTSTERFVVNLSELSSQTLYQVAIGFYNPQSGERLTPQNTDLIVESNRLFIGSFELP